MEKNAVGHACQHNAAGKTAGDPRRRPLCKRSAQLSQRAPRELLGTSIHRELLGTSIHRELLGTSIPRELLGTSIRRELLGTSIPRELLGTSVPRELLGTSIPRIFIVCRGIAIAFCTLAGSHPLALRIACETAIYAGLSIRRAIVAMRYDGWSPTVCRSWRC